MGGADRRPGYGRGVAPGSALSNARDTPWFRNGSPPPGCQPGAGLVFRAAAQAVLIAIIRPAAAQRSSWTEAPAAPRLELERPARSGAVLPDLGNSRSARRLTEISAACPTPPSSSGCGHAPRRLAISSSTSQAACMNAWRNMGVTERPVGALDPPWRSGDKVRRLDPLHARALVAWSRALGISALSGHWAPAATWPSADKSMDDRRRLRAAHCGRHRLSTTGRRSASRRKPRTAAWCSPRFRVRAGRRPCVCDAASTDRCFSSSPPWRKEQWRQQPARGQRRGILNRGPHGAAHECLNRGPIAR